MEQFVWQKERLLVSAYSALTAKVPLSNTIHSSGSMADTTLVCVCVCV